MRLLIVEDEADHRYLLQKLPQGHGAQVSVAEDADTGLKLLRHDRPQAIISDTGLPGVDGYEFLSRVRELPEDQGGRTPAIALTAFARGEDRQRALKAGFLAHIIKPADATELVSTLTKIVNLAERGYRSGSA